MTKTNQPETQAIEVIEQLPPVTYDLTAQGIKRLKKECAAFTMAPENPADYKALTQQIAKVRTTRTAIEKRRKELKAPLLKYGKKVDAKATSLKDSLQGMELPLIDLKAIADEVKAKAKQLAQEAEQARLRALSEKLDEIKQLPFTVTGLEEIRPAIEQLEGLEITIEVYEEMAPLAEIAVQEALVKLRQRGAQLEADLIAEENRQAELAEIETQRQAQEKLAEEQAEAQAKLDEQQRAIDAQQEAIDKREREAQEKREAEEKEKREAQDKIDREAAEKKAAAALKKEAASQARKQAKWKQLILADLPAVEQHLTDLADMAQPKVKTSEMATILNDVRVLINEARTQADGFRTLVEHGEGHD